MQDLLPTERLARPKERTLRAIPRDARNAPGNSAPPASCQEGRRRCVREAAPNGAGSARRWYVRPLMASPRPRSSSRSRLLATFAVLALAAGVAAGCGSSDKGSSAGSTTATSAANASKFESAGVLEPIRQAPPLQLKNSLGQPVNIDSYRGKAVLVTFIYTHCPDVCPLIVSNLRVAQNLLGKEASKAQIIAVSVDPKGDTAATVKKFLASHEMTGRMQYLIGNKQELGAAWKAWGVGAEQDATNPALVEHSGLVYGISGSGKRITIYAANFKPSEVAHDVPLLAAD